MERTLTTEEARAFYDRFGSRQDTQSFYEDRGTTALIAHAAFNEASAVFEFGCGTGRFAERLLAGILAPSCRYVGVDISSTMVGLAGKRLERWAAQAEVRLSGSSMALSEPDRRFDRFVSNYTLDLLSTDDIRALLAEAYRVLAEDGKLCLVSLTPGQRYLTQLVSRLWQQVHRIRPALVGGCRPINLLDYLPASQWRITNREVVTSFGISSEVVVASRLPCDEEKR